MHSVPRRSIIAGLMSAALFSVLVGCGADLGPEDDGDGFGDLEEPVRNAVAVAILHQGTELGTGAEHDRLVRIFSDQVAYEDELIRYASDANAAQDIDFDQYQLVLIDMGTQPTGGYAVAVTDSYVEESVVTLEVTYTLPENDCSVTTSQTNPYLFVRVESVDNLTLSEEIAITEC